MKKEDIINAYVRIRKIDNTIPDEVLNFMKDCAIKTIEDDSEYKCIKCKDTGVMWNYNHSMAWSCGCKNN